MGRFFFVLNAVKKLSFFLKDIQTPLSFPDHYRFIFRKIYYR